INYLQHLTDSLAQLPHIREAISLTTVENIVGTDYGLEINYLFDKNLSVSELENRIQRNPFIYGTLVSRDFQTVAIMLILERNNDKNKSLGEYNREIDTGIRDLLLRETAHTGRQFHLGGELITDAAINELMDQDISLFFPLSMLISAIFLWIIFRNLSSILFPLLTVFIALVWVLGLKGYVGSPITPVSTTLFALITIIGLANSVHLISQFRLEINTLQDKKAAIIASLTKAGAPCFFTSLTTAIGFGSLITSPIPGINNLGIFAAIGIMSSFILSIILIPIGLLWLTPKYTKTVFKKSTIVDNCLNKIADINEKHRVIVIAAFTTIIIFMALGIPRIRIEGSMIEYLKHSTRLYQDTQYLDQHLSGVSSTEIIIHGDTDSFKNPELLRDIEALQKRLALHPQVSVSYSVVDHLKLIYRSLNSEDESFYRIPETKEAVAQCLLMYEISGGEEINKYITTDYDIARISIIAKQMDDIQNKLLFAIIDEFLELHFNDYEIQVTGFDYLVNQLTGNIINTQITSLRTALIVILVLMLLIFGPKLGFLSLLPNVFPIVFILGLMGWAGFRLNMATAIIASVAIGIVVDDTIHYFTHFKYEYQRSKDIHKAMRAALTGVGRALMFTSLILTTGFLIFIFSETRILMDFGILASIAIFTALLGDLFIGPVLLSSLDVLRKRFWK
ncbi:MAG: MMPL family transporter, partial [bacterium]